MQDLKMDWVRDSATASVQDLQMPSTGFRSKAQPVHTDAPRSHTFRRLVRCGLLSLVILVAAFALPIDFLSSSDMISTLTRHEMHSSKTAASTPPPARVPQSMALKLHLAKQTEN